MDEPLHLRGADARVLPWKNGRGTTRELALWPCGASFERGDFDWRISAAAVAENGPFSPFPGLERVLVLTEGAGLWLEHGGASPRVHVERLAPYRFAGEWPTSAELCGGPVEDFNVLCRRGKARAEVEVWRVGPEHHTHRAQDEQLFLHLVEGRLEARAERQGRVFDLAAGESLWLRAHAARELRVLGDAVALLVRLERG
jgi:uncharacterized protein